VAEELHFGRAALRLGISQPPLSQQIKQLETEIGIELFSRTKRKVEITEAGQVFLQHARQTLADAQNCIVSAQRAAQGEMGSLSIGYSPAAACAFLPEIIPQFRNAVPNVALHLHGLGTSQQLDALRSHQIDIAFLWKPISDETLKADTIFLDHWMVAMRADDPLSRYRQIPAEIVSERPLIICDREDNTIVYDETIRYFKELNVPLNVVQETDSYTTSISLVSFGMGIALVPNSTIVMRRKGLIYRPLKDDERTLSMAMAYDPQRMTPSLGKFLEVVEEKWSSRRRL